LSKSVFTLEAVTYQVVGQILLSDLSFEVHRGDYFAVIGPSGAGKTTLLRLFNGLQSPTGGVIQFHGTSLEEMNLLELRRKVGMVFQRPTMILGTVRDNLNLFQRWDSQWSKTEEAIEQVLEQVNLDPAILPQEAGSLSGGEQQRVALARVLLNEPEVLLLDEPTSGMDPGLANQILRLITRLRDQLHLTVLIVTHYPRLLRDQVTKVLFLKGGKMLDYGGPELLVKTPSEELKRFLREEA